MSTWPYPGDGPLARARRVAHAYRAVLVGIDPDACAALDRNMRRWGQGWAIPRVVTYDPEAMLTPSEAADLLACDPATLRELRARGRLVGVKEGRTWRYRAADVIALTVNPRSRKRNTP